MTALGKSREMANIAVPFSKPLKIETPVTEALEIEAFGKMSPIFFDLDGTLTNPKPRITRSIQYALRKLDRDAPSEDDLTWCIGPPLRASFTKLLGTDTQADKALALYRERFADIGLFENE